MRGWPWSIAVVLAALALLSSPVDAAAAPAHGRVWELVTSGPTNGVLVFGERAWSDDGDQVVYASVGPMPGSPSGDLVANGLATRTAGGWTQQAIGQPLTIPSLDTIGSGPIAVSADMTSWVWSSSQPLLPGAPPTPQLAAYRRAPDGGFTLLGEVGDPSEFTFVAASDDVHHAIFQSTKHLLPADAGRTSGPDAYEFAGNELRLVGVDSAGSPLSTCGSQVGNGERRTSALTNAVSRDGQRIFFTAPTSGACGTPQRVYLREHGSQTTEISASHCGRPDCNPPQDATFAGALPDGSSAFIVTAQQLIDDDTDTSADLYRYDTGDGALTRLSAGPPGTDAGVSAPIRSSDDGALVYFIASGELVPGEGAPGTPNLFLNDHGTLRFVAPADGLELREAAIAADGRALAFATASSPLPGDTDGKADVFRYDAGTDVLERVSHGGDGEFDVSFGNTFSEAGHPLQSAGVRYMSADGRRLLFTTSEPLVANDVNTSADVYEWADGVVGLVSSGTGDSPATYGGLSADGRTAFFATFETLVPADRDGGDADLYAARLGGGFPVAPPPPPACQGDACQGVPGARLARPDPSSLSYVEPSGGDFRIRPLDRRARRRLARTGRATIVVDVPAAGRVTLRGYAKLHGRSTVVARVGATARGASRVRLDLQLSGAARRVLDRRHHLRVTLVLRLPRVGAAPALGVTLRRAA